MNRIIRCGAWVAMALCGLLISATVDKVPDSPAEVKQLTGAAAALSCDHPSQPSVDPLRLPILDLAVHRALLSWRFQPQRPGVLLPLKHTWLLRLAADSSPPSSVS